MKKNTASQDIGCQLITAADGTDFTGTATVVVSKDGAAQAASGGTGPTHLGGGSYTYTPTQAETNADHVAFTFSGTGAITSTVQVYTGFPQTSDNDTKITTIDTVVDAIKVTTDKFAFTVANQVDANMLAVSGDTTAADNMEAMYDGTGYIDDTAPASRAQVGSLSTGTAAISIQPESYTLTTGTQSSGTITDVETLNGVYHEHTDTAGVLDLYYQFDVGGSGVAVDANIAARINGSNDSVLIMAYDWAGSWDQIGTLAGTNGTADTVEPYELLVRNTGTGANLGKVRIRFYAASGLTSATLRVDRVSAAYSIVSQSVGYANGSIWVDTNDGTAGTETYVNGVADNPVLTFADALTLGSSLSLHRFQMAPSSSVTLAATLTDSLMAGHGWDLALGGQNVDGTHFFDCAVSGVATAANEMEFHDCEIETASLQKAHCYNCTFDSTVTWTLAGDYHLINCQSGVAGSGSPTFTKTPGQTVTAEFRRWSGGVTISNIESGDVLTVGGEMGTITLNGANGTVEVRGTYKAIVDNRTGSPALNLGGAIKGSDVADILVDTGTTIPASIATVDANVDAILIDTGTTLPTQITNLNNISTADILSSGDVDGYSIEETLKLLGTASYGKLSGAATTNVIIRAPDDSRNRIAATVDSDGNRTTVSLDAAG